MYKIDIKEALYPIQIALVVYKKFSKTSVFIDRKWPIYDIIAALLNSDPSRFVSLHSNIRVCQFANVSVQSIHMLICGERQNISSSNS